MSYEAFKEAHDWLFSLVRDPEGKRFSIPKTNAQRRIDMEAGLERSARFLAFADHPENRFRSVHVTGTSGKGSVSTMIAALLRGSGFKTALHTSPYLQLPTEKLIFEGQPIDFQSFADLIWQFKAIHNKWGSNRDPENRLRYTEAWNAITFLWLANTRPDWGVVEAGMGGRLDPTNLLPSSIAVVTNVAMDHVKSLGPSLSDIAWHKAGIIKPGRPAITGVRDPKLRQVIEAEAAEKESTLYKIGVDFDYVVEEAHQITVQTPFNRYENVLIGPLGRFQGFNAALAITAIDTLIETGEMAGPINFKLLEKLSIPGRMEIVDRAPITILDGAHNPHKMEAMITSLRDAYPSKRIIAIVGGIVNKEISGILEKIIPHTATLIATAPNVPGKPAVPPDEILEVIKQIEPPPRLISFAETDIEAALHRARSIATKEDLILVTGSLYLVGEARERWFPTPEV